MLSAVKVAEVTADVSEVVAFDCDESDVAEAVEVAEVADVVVGTE